MVLCLDHSRHSNGYSLRELMGKKSNELMNLTKVSSKRSDVLKSPSFPEASWPFLVLQMPCKPRARWGLSNRLTESLGFGKPRPACLVSMTLSSPVWFPTSPTASGSCWLLLIKAGRVASCAGKTLLSSAFHLCDSHFTQKCGRFIKSMARRLPLWLLVCLRLMNE